MQHLQGACDLVDRGGQRYALVGPVREQAGNSGPSGRPKDQALLMPDRKLLYQ
jgi:hypothetical protein